MTSDTKFEHKNLPELIKLKLLKKSFTKLRKKHANIASQDETNLCRAAFFRPQHNSAVKIWKV